ncbi:MAG: radical SAM protein [Candidatus Humimicrobiaceae bacterium]
MKIARVFPRRTEATPNDELVYIGDPPLLFMPEADEVHISVTFTYDIPEAERLYREWERGGIPVKMGGPAFAQPGGEFEPGMYLKHGYTITSRGCPNKCWFCSVWRREGNIRELPIKDGWIVNDDNILACSEKHVRNVFDMLKRQPEKPIFHGGLEAKILKSWHVELFAQVKPKLMFFAYDTPDDYEPLVYAGKMLREAGLNRVVHDCRCYVLIGYPKDTMEKAEKRLVDTVKAGFFPYAMLWKDENGNEDKTWRKFQREWCRPIIVGTKVRKILEGGI